MAARPRGVKMAAAPAGDSLALSLAGLQAASDPAAQERALRLIRTRLIKQPGGLARFRARGGLRHVLALLERPRARRALDMALSILGNCLTEAESRAQVRELGGIPLLVTILKSLSVDSVLNRTARALGNLAQEPESARIIHDAGALPHLVELLKSSQDAECLQSVIRALRHLADTASHRLSIAQHGAVQPMVEHLGSEDVALVEASARALSELTRGCSLDCAEHVSLNDGVVKLVALATHTKKIIQESVLQTLVNLCGQGVVRPTVGNAGGISCLVEVMKGQPAVSQPYIRALCLCCREAINRVRVREAGGLELLLTLAKDERYLQAHPRIIATFLNFFYDEAALEYLQANGLIPLLVTRLVALAGAPRGPLAPAEEEEKEDERYAASFDFPTEYNRRPDPEQQPQQAGESSSFQSLRSWLLSEGYIASPGELSPQWSSESGNPELDCQYMEGSISPTLGLQDIIPGPPEELLKRDPPDLDPGEGASITLADKAPKVTFDLEPAPETSDLTPGSSTTLEESASFLPIPATEIPGPPPPGELTSSPTQESKMSSTFCRRRRSKSRSVPGTCDGSPNFSEASTSTPVRTRCVDWSTPKKGSRDHQATPIHEILQASEMLAASFYKHEEVWSPEAPILLLLSRFSQVVDPSSALVTDFTLRGLLSYVARSAEPSHRCFRLLHRLTCNPNCLEAFVRTYGVPLIRTQLVLGLSQMDITASLDVSAREESMNPVQKSSWGHPERWCAERMKELGETLLRDLCVQAESPFGVGTLTHLILSGTETDKVACAVALPLICRKESLMRKLLLEGGGLALILEKLVSSSDPLFIFTATDSLVALVESMSRGSDPLDLQERSHHPDLPSSPRPAVKRARLELVAPDADILGPTCRYQRLLEAAQTDLHFRLDCGELVGGVRQELLSSSDVFQAMLGGEYLESRQNVIPIHGISAPVFGVLMHFLHGCPEGDPCLVLGGLRQALPEQGFESSVLGLALSAAGQYLLPGLQCLLEDSVYELLQLRSLPSVYCFCELHQNRSLQRRSLHYLLRGSHEPLARGRCLARLVQAAADQRALVDGLQAVVLEYL